MVGGAAADDRNAPVRQPPIEGDTGQPVRLRRHRSLHLLARHGCLYTMAAMGVFERHSLSNGLRVLTAPMPQAQSVSCFVMLAAGSRYETPETNGIAHFAEHMFFKGTERRPTARDIAGEIDAIGGEFNAFTGKEYTGYYVRCAAETRDTALDVIVDMLRNSRFDPDEIEREKGVIIEEMNMYFDTPRDFIGGVYESLLYGDQPLGWDIIGRKETVRGATQETFLDYTGTWYRPDRMVVGVGGRLGDGLAEKLEELLGDLPPAETGAPAPWQPSPNGRVKVHTKQSDQAHLVLGVRSRPLVDPDRYVLQLLATVLEAACRRASPEVRERRGLAYYVFGTNHAYTDAGSLYAQSGVDINRIDEAVTTIVEQFRLLASEAVPADELEKARNFAKGRFVLQLESPHGTIMFGLRREVLEGSREELQAVLDALDAVTAEDVQRVAQEIVDDGPYLAVIGPFDDAERFEKLAPASPGRAPSRLGDGLARVLDRGRVVRIPLPNFAPLESLERRLVLLGVEVLPAEVVEQRPCPVRGGLRPVGELQPAFRPGDEAVAIGRRERGHVRGVGREPVLARLDRRREGALEERQRRLPVAAGATQPAAFEVDADPDARVLLCHLVQQPVARLVVLAQPLHPRELRQRLRPQRAEPGLGRVEIVEVPECSQRVAHRPVVEKC